MSRLIRILPLLLTLPLLANAAEPVYDRVSLSESASAEVQNDLMVATLFAQREGDDTLRLADAVNRAITQAVAQARQVPGVQVTTLDYRTQPIYHKGRITAWRVTQTIRLRSADSKRLGKLLGALQGRLQLQSVGYQISEKQHRRHIDEVIRKALARFRQRADLVAQSLGKRHWRLVRLSVNDGGPRPVPVMRAKMMMADAPMEAAPVALAPGTTRIRVSVSGEIELSER